ncbi:hypothetical protein PMAYCL1PPCAC_26351, partial [Pristionchus mayeri]
ENSDFSHNYASEILNLASIPSLQRLVLKNTILHLSSRLNDKTRYHRAVEFFSKLIRNGLEVELTETRSVYDSFMINVGAIQKALANA